MMPDGPPLPRYGEASLAELVPSILASIGAAGFEDVLGLGPAGRVCLLVVDGLGWEQLVAHASWTPFLATRLDAARPITSGYPASTATSLAMLSTGLPPAAHGLLGYTMATPGAVRAMNVLTWSVHGSDPPEDLRERVRPEAIQPHRPLLERAIEAGIRVAAVGPAFHVGSGLTRAILRGVPFRPIESLADPAAIGEVADALDGDGPAAVYVYHPAVDTAGHRHGPASRPWRDALATADGIVEALARAMPSGSRLIVTADHGMVDLSGAPAERLDVADVPELAMGVRFLAGEARARHVHVVDGMAVDVAARWRDRLGERAWVAGRDDAIDAGWFGPPAAIRPEVRERIGDVVVAARTALGIFHRRIDPYEASLAGHHGSFTSAEQLVPLWVLDT